MERNKILVTGGAGYIGSHTVVELQNAGFEVLVVDNLSNSSAEVMNGIAAITGKRPELVVADCCDLARMDALMAECTNIAGIIHFAASKAVGESVEKPLMYYRNNIVSLVNMLELSLKYGVGSFVFSSSCTVYGQPEQLPVTEQSPIQVATSPYGNTKQICEEIIRDTVHANPTLRCCCLRYFNPIGAHPSALIGELPNGVPNNLVPYITQTAIGIRECLSVFGSDYNTPDGSCIRDYINVVDLAKAHVVAVQRMLGGRSKQSLEFFNLGTGNGLSVLELVRVFEKVANLKLPHRIVGRREGDIEQVWADPTRANTELGWKAASTTEETLLSAWKWEQALAERRKK